MEITNNIPLLEVMVSDSKAVPEIFQPGPYWKKKTINSVSEIRRCGISNFRGSDSSIGLSYSDNLFIDARQIYNDTMPRKILQILANSYPISRIFSSQVAWTKIYAYEGLDYAAECAHHNPRIRTLLSRYVMPYSLLGDCLRKINLDGRDISIYYLEMLDQHDRLAEQIKFREIRSIIEIGGGFGANLHLLIENYNNIRKLVYLDIPPNLYVGTQYLKALYPDYVLDYQSLRPQGRIEFSTDDRLEILCIAPWQIERLNIKPDLLINMHSFVEMPKQTVKNYIQCFEKLPQAASASVALVSYDNFDSTTIPPDQLPDIFMDRQFMKFVWPCTFNSKRRNLFYVSNPIK